jgi:hypothetical protein
MKFTVLLVCIICLTSAITHADPVGTAFTYQGQLSANGVPANGTYDFVFTLFTNSVTGDQVGSFPATGVPVTNGIFTSTIDFGTVFNGTAYWLGISVRTNEAGSFTQLTPRQPITPTPNALFSAAAGTAATASNVANGSVTAAGIATATITGANIASGQVVKTLNGLQDSVTLLAGSNVTITPGSQALTIAATGSGAPSWSLTGNAGTAAGINFLGTKDNEPLELWVNARRALRLEPNSAGAPNVIGGSPSNLADPGVSGATIAGGGATNYPQVGAYTNRVSSDFGTIGGGGGNAIQSDAYYETTGCTVGGGIGNTIQSAAFQSTISGGANNVIQRTAYNSTIGGGTGNAIQSGGYWSFIGGGKDNTIETNTTYSCIGGGSGNAIQTAANFSAIMGGLGNMISSAGVSSIGGGEGNSIGNNVSSSTIGGGQQNGISSSAVGSTIGGGAGNGIQAGAGYATIPGGSGNVAGGQSSFAAGTGAYATNDGSFVWNDDSGHVLGSTNANSVTFRASGGYRFLSSVSMVGAWLAPGSGAWSSLSDLNAKERFQPVDSQAILGKVARLPVTTWSYKTQDSTIRHIGPTAQDFKAAFGVGETDTAISTVDEGGVALAALKGLNQKLEEQLEEKDTKIRTLEQRLDRIEKIVSALADRR